MTQLVRRAAAVFGISILLLALTAGLAAAESSVPSGTWKDSKVNSIAVITAPPGTVGYSGVIYASTYNPLRTKPILKASIAPDPCTGTAPEAGTVGSQEAVSGRGRYDFTGTVVFNPTRNGSYFLHVCFGGVEVDTPVAVQYPAPVVTGVSATGAGRAVAVTWDDMSSIAPDVSGYTIQRRLGAGGDFVALASVASTVFAFSDTSLPTAGGDATYRVLATRPLVADSAPSGESTATFAAAPPASTVPGGTDAGADTGTDSGPGGGTGTTTPGGGSGSGGSGGGTSGGTSHPRHTNRVIIRAPRVGTPSAAFFPPLLTPPKASDVDTGFNEELPYDPETGEEDPVLPNDELASSPLEQAPGRGLAIPVATALVLAVWAFHLRYLAKASKPIYVDDFLEPYSD